MSVKRIGDRWYVDVQTRTPEGTVVRVREPAPVDNKRGAHAHEKKVLGLIQSGQWVHRARKRGRPRKGTHPGQPVTDAGVGLTLAAFVPKFLRHQAAKNRASDVRLKTQILYSHLLPAFGEMRLDEITTEAVDHYVTDKLESLARQTVGNHIITLKRLLHQAHEWGHIDRVPKIKQLKAPPPGKRKFDFMDFDEAERFLAAAGKWRPFMLVAMRTGLRLGELRGLQWGDVDLERRRVRVERAFTKDGWGEPKSGSGRTVPLASDALVALQSLRPPKATRTTLVFPGTAGRPLDEHKAYDACMRAARGAGIAAFCVRDKPKGKVIAGPFPIRRRATMALRKLQPDHLNERRLELEKDKAAARQRGDRQAYQTLGAQLRAVNAELRTYGVVSETRKIGPHILRHTFASHHAMRGTPLAVIQKWLGHASIEITMMYAHLAADHDEQFADNIVAADFRGRFTTAENQNPRERGPA